MLSFVAPQSLGELAAVLTAGSGCWMISGGTDRLIAPAALPRSGVILDLSRLAGLDRIALAEGRLALGAGVTVARLANDALVA
ncbi:MAG: FAD-binding protein, partial [Albidovulum sp.]|uniref:FAD binding domain-containing protein n=1 Tax=Albidovulum sp. TaxID=1872424 RepID=UPI001321F516